MNTHSSPLFSHAVALSALFALGTSGIAAVISDNFSGTYPGGGSGWAGDWNYRHYRTTAPDSKAEYRNINPLPGSDNYLNVRYNYNVDSSGGYSIVSRPFDTTVVDNQQAHKVSFDFRLDFATHWNNEAERIAFFAASQAVSRNAAYNATTTNTWGLSYDGANGWTVIESDGAGGIRFVSPSVQFQSAANASTVYSITLNIDPTSRSFTVSITDGDRTENWDNTAFNFINPAATASGNHLHFYAHSRRGVQTEYSLANLHVDQIPEPSTTALAGITVAGLGLRGWFQKSKAQKAK
jgi:hypothetical protein